MGEGNFSRVSLFAGVCLSLGPADGCSGALVLSELVMFFGGACLSVCTPESVLQSVTPSEREGNLTRLASTVCSVCCFEPLGRATHPGIVLEFLGPICTASSWHGGILRGGIRIGLGALDAVALFAYQNLLALYACCEFFKRICSSLPFV